MAFTTILCESSTVLLLDDLWLTSHSYYSLGKIYANTLLATLNSRMTFITSSSQLSNSETALRLFSRGALWKDMGSVSTAGQSIDNGRVHVKTATVVFKDDSMSDRGVRCCVSLPLSLC